MVELTVDQAGDTGVVNLLGAIANYTLRAQCHTCTSGTPAPASCARECRCCKLVSLQAKRGNSAPDVIATLSPSFWGGAQRRHSPDVLSGSNLLILCPEPTPATLSPKTFGLRVLVLIVKPVKLQIAGPLPRSMRSAPGDMQSYSLTGRS
jgi:hypothetical protein